LKKCAIFQLHEYFSSLSDSQPFQFYSEKQLSKNPTEKSQIVLETLAIAKSPGCSLQGVAAPTQTHLDINSASVPIRRSAQAADLKRKQPDMQNSKDNKAQPNQKKRKSHFGRTKTGKMIEGSEILL